MSYINKDGKTTAWRIRVIRQQVSDVLAYGQIKTTLTKAKETRRHVDKIITLSTCKDVAGSGRVVMHAKLIKRETRTWHLQTKFDWFFIFTLVYLK